MNQLGQIVKPLLAMCALGAAVLVSITLIAPHSIHRVDAPATEFSAGRAMEDLVEIAREPHPMGISPAHAEVRDYLIEEIRSLGLEPQVQKTIGARVLSPGFVIAGAVENILVRLQGSDAEGAIVLMSHYDSAPDVPGAADSGSGVVTVLELLRALRAGPSLGHDVIFIFSDGEEPGTIGAHAIVDQHPWFEDIGFVINMDQFIQGPPALLRSSQGNGVIVKAAAQSAARPTFLSLPYHLFPGGDTDFLPFSLAGVPGADIQTIYGPQEVHTVLDRPEIVNPASIQLGGEQLLGVVRYLADQPALETSVTDQTFFPFLGRLIHYPAGWAIPLAVAAGLLFLGALYVGLRQRTLTWSGLGLGLLTFVVGLVLSLGITYLLWLVIQVLHPEYAYSPLRVHLNDDWLYVAGFVFISLALMSLAIAVARKKITAFDLAGGGLLFWLVGAIVVAFLVPVTSYLTSWTLLIGSLALLTRLLAGSSGGRELSSGLAFLASAILVTFVWVPVIYVSVFGSGMPMVSMIIGLAALWLGSMMPLFDWISASNRWGLPAAALLCGLGFLLAGNLIVAGNSPPPPVNPVGYWLDADEDAAYWIGFSEELDERQKGLLAGAERQSYQEVFSRAPAFTVACGEAPRLDLEGPTMKLLADEWKGDRRLTRVRFRTSMHDRLYVIIPGEVNVLAMTIPQNERIELGPTGLDFILRFDGMPAEGLELAFEVDTPEPYPLFAVEERTGLPSFPGLSTRPSPGTMSTPGEFLQAIPTDFTAISRDYMVPEPGG